LAGFGWFWLVLAGSGRILIGSDQFCSVLISSDQFWSVLLGSGQVWPVLAEFDRF